MRRLAVFGALAVLTFGLASPVTGAQPGGLIRVDQVGYAIGEAKVAYLLAKASTTGRFQVINERGRRVHEGRIAATTGSWNAEYAFVYPLNFSTLTRPGRYRVQIGQSRSPEFRIARPAQLFDSLVKDTVNFFQVQRDGAHVIAGENNRKPSHLTDRQAMVHHQPVFGGDGWDVPIEPLQPWANAPSADVEGGWFDAGDFVKFTHASAYALSEMLYTQRLLGERAPAVLQRETGFGLSWLDKMWDPARRNLYVQVGIGTGSEEFGFLGDHDV